MNGFTDDDHDAILANQAIITLHALFQNDHDRKTVVLLCIMFSLAYGYTRETCIMYQ